MSAMCCMEGIGSPPELEHLHRMNSPGHANTKAPSFSVYLSASVDVSNIGLLVFNMIMMVFVALCWKLCFNIVGLLSSVFRHIHCMYSTCAVHCTCMHKEENGCVLHCQLYLMLTAAAPLPLARLRLDHSDTRLIQKENFNHGA